MAEIACTSISAVLGRGEEAEGAALHTDVHCVLEHVAHLTAPRGPPDSHHVEVEALLPGRPP